MVAEMDPIAEVFPHPLLPPIIGIPTYESIAELHIQLNANAASVQSNLGDGQLGLLPLTVSPAVYNTLSAIPFIAPVNPGTTPNIPAGTTAAVASRLVRQFSYDTKIFREYNATDHALKQQIIGCINRIYLRTLSHPVTGFANITTRHMLQHLYRSYGRINPAALLANDSTMKTAYDPNQPIEGFIDQIEDCVAFADAGLAPYTVPQIISTAYTLMFNTSMFPDACRVWRRRALIDQTWANFKLDFIEAHQEYRDCQATSTQAGYHSAHSALEIEQANAAFEAIQTETALALANLATATASDRSSVASLTTTNSSLTSDLTSATSKLSVALSDIATLKRELAALRPTTTNTRNQEPPKPWTPNTSYCWTHVYKVARSHTSATCTYRHNGHRNSATRANTMGGSQLGKPTNT